MTTWTAGLDLDYALNEDETRGLLTGVSVTYNILDNPTGTIHPIMAFYGGAYYQWDSGWKLTGRGGMQHFGGAQLGTILQLKQINAPFMAVDFERYDDNDNRLFGVTAAVAWSPKPAFQVTLSTPLYFVRR